MRTVGASFCLLAMCWCRGAGENPLGDVHTAAPPPPVVHKEPATERGSTIRSNVDLVLVPVSVTDSRNRIVTGLERENFQITENGTGQTIKSFATETRRSQLGLCLT